jgi:hypothetical protein
MLEAARNSECASHAADAAFIFVLLCTISADMIFLAHAAAAEFGGFSYLEHHFFTIFFGFLYLELPFLRQEELFNSAQAAFARWIASASQPGKHRVR